MLSFRSSVLEPVAILISHAENEALPKAGFDLVVFKHYLEGHFVNINDPEDFVFGYFFATNESLIRVRVDSTVTGSVRPLCPSLSPCFAGAGGGCICGLCCDCLLDPTSTTVQPPYWND